MTRAAELVEETITQPSEVRVKEKDAWWTVAVVDPLVALFFPSAARASWVTPNRLSLASLAVAFAAAASFAGSELVLGACLFQVSFLLDCMDGKLAHSRGQSNPFGAWLDSVVDAGRMSACYGGLVWALASDGGLERGATTIAVVYPILAYAVIVTGHAWPRRGPAGALVLEASPVAFARAIPRRMGTPASPVDAEAVVFTLGPLLGMPVLGIWIGALLNGVHLVAAWGVRGREARAASVSSSFGHENSLGEASDD